MVLFAVVLTKGDDGGVQWYGMTPEYWAGKVESVPLHSEFEKEALHQAWPDLSPSADHALRVVKAAPLQVADETLTDHTPQGTTFYPKKMRESRKYGRETDRDHSQLVTRWGYSDGSDEPVRYAPEFEEDNDRSSDVSEINQ